MPPDAPAPSSSLSTRLRLPPQRESSPTLRISKGVGGGKVGVMTYIHSEGGRSEYPVLLLSGKLKVTTFNVLNLLLNCTLQFGGGGGHDVLNLKLKLTVLFQGVAET